MNTFTFNVFLLSSNFFNNFSLKKLKILVENKNTLIVIVFIYENSLKKIYFLLKIYVFSQMNTFTFNVFILVTAKNAYSLKCEIFYIKRSCLTLLVFFQKKEHHNIDITFY